MNVVPIAVKTTNTRLNDAAEFSVYLQDEATSEQRGAIEAALDASGVTNGREYVSKQQAEAKFKARHADLAAVADDRHADGGRQLPCRDDERAAGGNIVGADGSGAAAGGVIDADLVS